jgi:very-short-patch-repair endonuclease
VILNNIELNRDLVASILKGNSGSVQLSELQRGLINQGIEVDYHQLEDWVLDQIDLFKVSKDGSIGIRPGIDTTHIRPTPIIPELSESNSDINSDTRMHRLIRYYVDCLKETGKNICAYRSQQDASFITLDRELYSAGKGFASISTGTATDFIKNLQGGNKVLYYGYPLLLQWGAFGSDGERDYRIVPVYICRLELQPGAEKCYFHLASKTIRLNPFIINGISWKDRSFVIEKLDAVNDQYSGIGARVELLESVLQKWDAQEELDPATIVRRSNLSAIPSDKSGFYNKCAIFIGGQTPYTAGLIYDLEELQEINADDLGRTALGTLIQSSSENKNTTKADTNKIQIFSPSDEGHILNGPQEAACKNAFTQSISVVTGPPGTGKSQVVAAIITTAIMEGKSVLFASRNSKAIDVVQERFGKICPNTPVLVRVGGIYDKSTLDYMDRLSNLPINESTAPFSRQMKSLEPYLWELEQLNETFEKFSSAMTEARLAEDLFDGLKRQFTPRRVDAYEAIQSFDVDRLLRVAKRFEKLTKQASKFPKLIFPILLWANKAKGKDEISALMETTRDTDIDFPLTWPQSKEFVSDAFTRLLQLIDFISAAEKMKCTAEALKNIGRVDELFEKITDTRKEIGKKSGKLIEIKVREDASGGMQSEETHDALLQYRDIVPQFKKFRGSGTKGQAISKTLEAVFARVLKRLPCWAVTNLSISGRIPLSPGIFELLVIDEASQCDIPSCIPLLYRAKQAVIIGDPLQLPQITQITQSDENHFLHRNQVDGMENNHLRYSDKSMYDAARRVTPQAGITFLTNHYRCHPEIIQFANSAHWYEDRLEVFTDVKRLNSPKFCKRGVEWVQVKSHVAVNAGKVFLLPEEVIKTVDIVKDLLEKHKYEGTVGVVCPHRKMVNRIRDQIEKAVDARLLQSARFEAQTAHGFQGDERDVIVYAMGVHADMPRGPKWFVAENSNLFNVALSRARAVFIVVGDMTAVENVRNDNTPIAYLTDFVAYFKSLGEKQTVEPGEPVFTPEQLWEERFYLKALKPANLPVYAQYPLGPYKLDFALLRKGRIRKLDIEIDGEAYHKDTAGRRLRRDMDRNVYVRAQDGGSWDVMRFWVYELREDMDACLKKIQHWASLTP